MFNILPFSQIIIEVQNVIIESRPKPSVNLFNHGVSNQWHLKCRHQEINQPHISSPCFNLLYYPSLPLSFFAIYTTWIITLSPHHAEAKENGDKQNPNNMVAVMGICCWFVCCFFKLSRWKKLLLLLHSVPKYSLSSTRR